MGDERKYDVEAERIREKAARSDKSGRFGRRRGLCGWPRAELRARRDQFGSTVSTNAESRDE